MKLFEKITKKSYKQTESKRIDHKNMAFFVLKTITINVQTQHNGRIIGSRDVAAWGKCNESFGIESFMCTSFDGECRKKKKKGNKLCYYDSEEDFQRKTG